MQQEIHEIPLDALREIEGWSAEELRARLEGCRRCAEEGYFIGGPPLVRNGPLPAPIFVLGQAPAAIHADDPSTPPFSPGRHGQASPLWRWLEQAGWLEEEFRVHAFMTAITRCYPGAASTGSGDRRPVAREQLLCRPFWMRELQLAEPRVIITLGTMALHALGFRGVRLGDAVGQRYEVRLGSRTLPLVPLPHPSGVSRWLNEPANRALLDRGLEHIEVITRPVRRAAGIMEGERPSTGNREEQNGVNGRARNWPGYNPTSHS